MNQLTDIPNLDPKAIELLQASGFTDVTSLKKHTLSEIAEETYKTNEILDIYSESPSDETIASWLKPLEFEPPVSDPAVADAEPIFGATSDSDHIISPQALLSASYAIPISQRFIDENSIVLDNLLAGKIKFISEKEALKHISAKELNTPDPTIDKMVTGPAKPLEEDDVNFDVNSGIVEETSDTEIAELKQFSRMNPAAEEKILSGINQQPMDELDEILAQRELREKSHNIISKKRIQDMETFRQSGSRIEPLVSASANDLTRSTKKETNAGVDPNSRRFIKGVLHSRAGDFMVSTLAFLLFVALVISAFAITPLLFVDKEKYWWAMFAPLLAFLGVFIYFAFTRRAMCPICNQRQYAIKRCLKHSKAHYWGPLGYMLPTAIHVVLFKWFRCIFCGTSVRLKE